MPCRAFLAQLREHADEIDAMGAGVVGVATGAGWQAERLMEQGTPFPLLVDRERNVFRALGLERIRWYRWLLPTTWWRYAKGSRGARQGALTGDILQAPGVAVIAPDRRVLYLYRGRTLADYPPVAEVIAAVRRHTS